jgi:hypothetical protein
LLQDGIALLLLGPEPGRHLLKFISALSGDTNTDLLSNQKEMFSPAESSLRVQIESTLAHTAPV